MPVESSNRLIGVAEVPGRGDRRCMHALDPAYERQSAGVNLRTDPLRAMLSRTTIFSPGNSATSMQWPCAKLRELLTPALRAGCEGYMAFRPEGLPCRGCRYAGASLRWRPRRDRQLLRYLGERRDCGQHGSDR